MEKVLTHLRPQNKSLVANAFHGHFPYPFLFTSGFKAASVIHSLPWATPTYPKAYDMGDPLFFL